MHQPEVSSTCSAAGDEEACIVCGTDLSENARPALEVAAALAGLGRAELWVVHARDSGDTEVSGGAVPEAEERLAAWTRDVAALHAVSRVRQAVLVGAPAESLSAFADERRAAAIVVSSRGHSAGPLFKLGGTSERIAVESSVPVLVVRDATPFTRWGRGEAPLRVLLAVDFTATSDPAVHFARFLRDSGRTEIIVAHVYYPGVSSRYGLEPLEVSGEPGGSLEALLARDLKRRVGALEGGAGVVYRPYAGTRRIGDDVLEVAREERADVIIVGTHAKRGYRRLASVSSVVLHEGRTAIVCAPRAARNEGAEPMPAFRSVLVPTDLSESSKRAIPCAYRLLLDRGGEVWLLHVATSRTDAPVRDAHLHRQLRALVPSWSAGRGVVSRTEVLHGDDVARTICQTAALHGVDVICATSRPADGSAGANLGSVAEQVVRQSDRPVVIVPTPPR